MRKLFFTFFIISIFAVSCIQSDSASQVPEGEYIQWRSENKTADALVLKGMFLYMNFEQEIAFFIINDYLHYAVYSGVFITIGVAFGKTISIQLFIL